MKFFATIERLVQTIFRKDNQDITLRPNNSTTFTTSQTLDLPPPDPDNADILVGEDAAQTLSQKTLISAVLNADVSGTAIVTTVGTPGSDVLIPSEQAVREGIDVVNTDLTTHTGASSGVHGVTGNVVGTSDTQTLTNKNFENNTTRFVDEIDNTKQFRFITAGAATGTTQTFDINNNVTGTYSFPQIGVTDEVVMRLTSQTLGGKTLDDPVFTGTVTGDAVNTTDLYTGGSTDLVITSTVNGIITDATEDSSPDGSDFVLFYDASEGVNNKVQITDLLGVAGGITSLGGLTVATQTFATGTTGSDFNIDSTGSTHTFNIPDASASNRGLITTGTQTIAGAKTFTSNLAIESGADALSVDSGTSGPQMVFGRSGSSTGWGYVQANNVRAFSVFDGGTGSSPSIGSELLALDHSGNMTLTGGATTLTLDSQTTGPQLVFGRSGSSTGWGYVQANATRALSVIAGGTGSSPSLGSEVFAIDQSGRVGIGASSPNHELEVVGHLRIRNSVSARVIDIDADAPGSVAISTAGIQALSGTTQIVRWSTSTGELMRDTSSSRYKKDITDTDVGLAEVNQLSVKKYKRIADDTDWEYGLIAEEVDLVLPSLVGRIDIEGTSTIDSVDYSYLSAILVKAIQELSADNDAKQVTIDAQQTAIDDLLTRVTALENP